MPNHRKRYSADLKAKVALDRLPGLFLTQASKQEKQEKTLIASPYQQIGQ